MTVETLLISIGIAGLFFTALPLLVVKRILHHIRPTEALVVTSSAGSKVFFRPRIVLPVLQRAERIGLALQQITLIRTGRDGLICKDNLRADITVSFFVRVRDTEEDILKVAASTGCKRAGEASTVEELFGAMFSEAMKTVGKMFDFEQLFTEGDAFHDKLIMTVGENLSGFCLEDISVDDLRQTPPEALDRNNILDAAGLAKIDRVSAALLSE